MDRFAALVLSLPACNSTLRMRLWRSLKEAGCGVLRDGVYLLPSSPSAYEVLAKLDTKMTSAFLAVSELARKEKLYMRDAAYVIAVSRVADACRERGWV